MTSTKIRRYRAPNGVVSSKPIALRLTADERERVDCYAAREHRSMASFARLLFLASLTSYEQQDKYD